MTPEFDAWWDSDKPVTDNPYHPKSPAYWAWAGWNAGVTAEREACIEDAINAEPMDGSLSLSVDDIIRAIRARGRAQTV